MTTVLDVHRTAAVLIREHGEEADLVAARRADGFLASGDVDGSAIRKKVLAAVKEFRREAPRDGEAVK
jgi:hypothetical protein